MYKIAGVGLIGLFIFMILPTNVGLTDTTTVEGAHYGAVSLVVHDANGNERFSQTIHNLLTNDGEDYILDMIFENTVAGDADNVQIGTVCVSDPGGKLKVLDTETAATFDTANTIGEVPCIQGGFNATSTSNGIATIGPLTFNSSSTSAGNVGDGDRIDGIGICQSLAANHNPYNTCVTGNGGASILFSVINTANITLADTETIDITYTFDISSSSN